MHQSNQEINPYQTDEIDLRKLAKLLKERRWFILGFTGIVTLLGIVYALSLPPSPYVAITSFVSPSQSSVLSLNRFPLTNETSESIFINYLRKLSEKEFQKKVFYGNDYLTFLNPENEPIDDVEDYDSGFLDSISVEAPDNQGQDKKADNLLEKSYSISMEGSDGEIISRFLNELVVSANNETVNDFINITNQKIAIRLDQISNERGLLLAKAQSDRLSQIIRIKEEDAQKIRELNDIIERAKFKAKKERLNSIQILTAAAKLAGSLGIIENNLGQISDSNNDINLNIAINEDLPEWYLFGEKALLERVELLKSRTSDDPYIPELVSLNNQINEIQNNNLLQTLEERLDDSPFIARVNELDIERINLESIIPESSGIDTMQLTQPTFARQIPNSRRTIVVISFVAGFVLSIFLILMMYLFKEDDTEPTTKTSR
jgi:chain length determinant protein (polysaccharide antigen chain regulator)